MNTAEIASLINKETRSYSQEYQDIYGYLDVDHILKTVDIIGKDNEHLANPLNKDPQFGEYFLDRKVPLTGNELVIGDYWLFAYGARYETMYLVQYDSIEELENQIISDGGIINTYVTCLIAIVKGKVKRYQILCERSHLPGKIILRKEEQVKKFPFENLTNIELKWID